MISVAAHGVGVEEETGKKAGERAYHAHTHTTYGLTIDRHVSVYSLASKIPPLQHVTHTYSSSNSVPCSDGCTLCWMSCTKLYRDERWGRPPNVNIEEPLTVCVCARACVHVLMSQSEH